MTLVDPALGLVVNETAEDTGKPVTVNVIGSMLPVNTGTMPIVVDAPLATIADVGLAVNVNPLEGAGVTPVPVIVKDNVALELTVGCPATA